MRAGGSSVPAGGCGCEDWGEQCPPLRVKVHPWAWGQKAGSPGVWDTCLSLWFRSWLDITG